MSSLLDERKTGQCHVLYQNGIHMTTFSTNPFSHTTFIESKIGFLISGYFHANMWSGTALLLAGRFGDRIPVGGEIFCTRSDLPLGPPSHLYKGYRVSFSGAKRPGRGVDHPPYLTPRLKKE